MAHRMGGPSYKLVYRSLQPTLTIVISTINHSYISHLEGDLAILGAPSCRFCNWEKRVLIHHIMQHNEDVINNNCDFISEHIDIAQPKNEEIMASSRSPKFRLRRWCVLTCFGYGLCNTKWVHKQHDNMHNWEPAVMRINIWKSLKMGDPQVTMGFNTKMVIHDLDDSPMISISPCLIVSYISVYHSHSVAESHWHL